MVRESGCSGLEYDQIGIDINLKHIQKQFVMRKIYRPWTQLSLGALAVLAAGGVNAQYAPTPAYQGKIGKTVAETQQSWPEKKKVAAA